jgi:hypothetical protein
VQAERVGADRAGLDETQATKWRGGQVSARERRMQRGGSCAPARVLMRPSARGHHASVRRVGRCCAEFDRSAFFGRVPSCPRREVNYCFWTGLNGIRPTREGPQTKRIKIVLTQAQMSFIRTGVWKSPWTRHVGFRIALSRSDCFFTTGMVSMQMSPPKPDALPESTKHRKMEFIVRRK